MQSRLATGTGRAMRGSGCLVLWVFLVLVLSIAVLVLVLECVLGDRSESAGSIESTSTQSVSMPICHAGWIRRRSHRKLAAHRESTHILTQNHERSQRTDSCLSGSVFRCPRQCSAESIVQPATIGHVQDDECRSDLWRSDTRRRRTQSRDDKRRVVHGRKSVRHHGSLEYEYEYRAAPEYEYDQSQNAGDQRAAE